MPQKIRLFSLVGLLLALATGFVAARPGGEEERACPHHYLREGQAVKHRIHASTDQAKAKEKCCCTPGKPCDNCACKEKPKEENSTPTTGCLAPCGSVCAPCAPQQGTAFGIWSSTTLDTQMPQLSICCPWMTGTGPAPMACMPYPEPAHYTQSMPVPPGPWMPYATMPAPYGMYPPPIPVTYASGSLANRVSKEYVVEMKLVEQHKGEKEKIVAEPKLVVMEGESGEVTSGTSHANLWAAGVPANDFGHEGYQIDVSVQGDRADHVRLTCAIWTSALDSTDHSGKLRESRCESTRLVEVGKATKFSCDRAWNGEVVHCWLEAVVKEQKETRCEECGCCEACESCPTTCGVCPKESCKAAETMTFSTVDPRQCSQTMCGADGKEGDLNPPCKLLRVSSKGACLTCDKFEVQMAHCEPVQVSVDGDRVMVVGEKLKAMADTVSTAEEGVLVLEGHVRVVSHQEKIDVESGRVRIKLQLGNQEEIIQTGVISNPELIQQP